MLLFFIVLHILFVSSSGALQCTSGDCIFDCSKENCNEVICTDSADSCTVWCGGSECERSTFYLAATVNTVNCNGDDSCKESNFHCGLPPSDIPFGFSSSDFDDHISSCVFTLSNNAMSDDGLVTCYHNIDFCLVETQSDNDDFKESLFECHLSPELSRCVLDCYNEKSCGSDTSVFDCKASECICANAAYLRQMVTDEVVQPTTAMPSVAPTLVVTTINDVNTITVSRTQSLAIKHTVEHTVGRTAITQTYSASDDVPFYNRMNVWTMIQIALFVTVIVLTLCFACKLVKHCKKKDGTQKSSMVVHQQNSEETESMNNNHGSSSMQSVALGSCSAALPIMSSLHDQGEAVHHLIISDDDHEIEGDGFQHESEAGENRVDDVHPMDEAVIALPTHMGLTDAGKKSDRTPWIIADGRDVEMEDMYDEGEATSY